MNLFLLLASVCIASGSACSVACSVVDVDVCALSSVAGLFSSRPMAHVDTNELEIKVPFPFHHRPTSKFLSESPVPSSHVYHQLRSKSSSSFRGRMIHPITAPTPPQRALAMCYICISYRKYNASSIATGSGVVPHDSGWHRLQAPLYLNC